MTATVRDKKLSGKQPATNDDSISITKEHQKRIQNKGFLRAVYKRFYSEMVEWTGNVPEGPRVEIGSGGGLGHALLPNIFCSDVVSIEKIDVVLEAEYLPFSSCSISAFYLLNVLHHLNSPVSFFREAIRCLKPTGRIVCIEPYNSLLSRFLYKHFHNETFDTTTDWTRENKRGRLTGGNNAIPWIIFGRDINCFKERFWELDIVRVSPHTWLTYILSGGVSSGLSAPTVLYKPAIWIERMFTSIQHELSLFFTVVLEKKPD